MKKNNTGTVMNVFFEGLYHFSIYHLSHHFLCFFLKANVCRNFESFPTTK